jgi:hypothetical protein
MSELKITRSQADISYLIVHDTGNYFLIDSVCTDAPGIPTSHQAVTSIHQSILPGTPLYNIDLTVGLSSVTCPATLSLTTGAMRPITKPICATGEEPPDSVHVLQPVFDASTSLEPDSEVTVTAAVDGNSAYSTTIATPLAPVVIGVGDSYVSGHHQDADRPKCVAGSDRWLVLIVKHTKCDSGVKPNDEAFSWIRRTKDDINERLAPPPQWEMEVQDFAKSGATTTEFGDASKTPGSDAWAAGGQVAQMVNALEDHSASWNIVGLSGGADDAKFSDVLAKFYADHFDQARPKPWDVTDTIDCPRASPVFDRLIDKYPTIKSNLQKIVDIVRAEGSAYRVIDIDYPYVVNSGNLCGPPFSYTIKKTTYRDVGSNTVVKELALLHGGVAGNNVQHVDLRGLFGTTSPSSRLQLTRLYGYPHPNDTGQDAIASAAADAVIGK